PSSSTTSWRPTARAPVAAAGTLPVVASTPQVVSPGLSEPVVAKRKKPQQDDPYAPLGIRVGGLRVLPAIEGLAGYDTNALRGTSGTRYKGSRLYQVVPELSVQSDWSRHALQMDLRGTYAWYQDVDDANRPTLDGKINFRADIRQDSTLTLELKEKIDSQRPGSTDLSGAVKGRPLYFVTSGSAAWAEKFGYATATTTATIDRYDYQDATTFSGATLSQRDRNYTAYGLKLRGAYELTPGISPFVEVAGDVREHDEKHDAATYRRNSHGATAKIGSTFELTRILTGEVSAGLGIRRYDDHRLPNLSGAIGDAALIWQMTPLTKVTGKVGTEFVETVQSGSPGAVSRKVSLEVAHDLLRNLTITGTAGFTHASYKGINRIEDTITAGLKADYKIDRNWIVRGSYGYERALSNQTSSSYLSHIFMMGVRLQQ
ncbi:MAG TPA: outer membrane beta-barrel protein, partial [Beijerinckiaceae bacterium]|nr:outer membrane beta-barrel protein [Beijerinckiaceae bacterium]